MKPDISQTAIVVFSLSPEEEKNYKPFMGYKNLGQHLRDDIIQKVKQTELPYIIYDESLQVGNSFGEKIANAIQTTFDKGYNNVIVVGNDTPELSFSILNRSIKTLNKGKVVYGRSVDRGIYLLGINKRHFAFEKMKSLPWQTNFLSRAFELYLYSEKVPFLRLKTLRDIDSISDISFVLKNRCAKVSHYLQQCLHRFFEGIITFEFLLVIIPFAIFCNTSYTRGSP